MARICNGGAAILNPMRLARATHEELERFFRVYRDDAALRLPPIEIHGGVAGRLMTLLAGGVGAITFGRHVFVSPQLMRRDADGLLRMPGWLLAHEAAHVLQYAERGWARFLRDYLSGYFGALRAGGRGWNRAARVAAYLAIREECEARAAEEAFAAGKNERRPRLI
jgi:hypothetical protein